MAERILKKVLEEVGLQQCEIFAVGAAPMRREVHEYFMSINVRLMELYGLSESSGPHTLNLIQPDRWKLGSCGKTIMGVQIKILEPNENGEGEVSGRRQSHKSGCKAYHNVCVHDAVVMSRGSVCYTTDVDYTAGE